MSVMCADTAETFGHNCCRPNCSGCVASV